MIESKLSKLIGLYEIVLGQYAAVGDNYKKVDILKELEWVKKLIEREVRGG